MGPKVGEFERALAAACGTADAVVVSSGTAALHLAMMALGIGPGDEVIVPAYTFPATANAVELCGGRAVLVDVDPDTFNLDSRGSPPPSTPRTKAVARGAPLRPPGRVGGAADGRAAGGRARRGRRRRARSALPRHALRLARRDGLPLVPPAQDRDDGRGRRRHDRRGRARRRDPPLPPPRDRAARRLRHPRAGPQLPAARPPLRDRDPPGRPARAAARGARARRRLVHRAARAPRADAVGRPTATGTAGRRTSSSSTAATRRCTRCGRRGSRSRSGPTPCTISAPTATGARFPGADRAFARALALPFATTMTEAECDRVARRSRVSCSASGAERALRREASLPGCFRDTVTTAAYCE